MARFVLVHGAWHGAWWFAEVVDALTQRGHDAHAVDLPCDQPRLTQHDYARLIGPLPDAIVVGHSLAAQTIPHVRARTRVYLGGLLPVPFAYRDAFVESFGGTVRDELDRSYWPDADTCAVFMYPDALASAQTGRSSICGGRRALPERLPTSARATWSLRRCVMRRSTPSGRSRPPASTARA